MPKLTEIRCKCCNAKLGEVYLISGRVQILCMKNRGKGLGPCRTLNIITGNEGQLNLSFDLSQKVNNAI